MVHGRDRASEAPERFHDATSAPQSVWHQQHFDPEPYNQHSRPLPNSNNNEYGWSSLPRAKEEVSTTTDNGAEGRAKRRQNIAGLSVCAFWTLLTFIAILVIGGSVGGAVGGTLAVKSSAMFATTSAGSVVANASPTSSPSSFTSVTSTSNPALTSMLTSHPTQSGATASTSSTSTQTSSPSIVLGISDCPSSNGTIYTPAAVGGGMSVYQFTKVCGHNANGADLAEAFVQTFDLCIAMCSNYNTYHASDGFPKCVGAFFNPGSGGAPPGNCWIKSGADLFELATSDAALLVQ